MEDNLLNELDNIKEENKILVNDLNQLARN